MNDIDDVHHTYEGIDDIYSFYALVKFLTLNDDFPHWSEEDIRLIGLESYKTTGDGLLGFVTKALEENLDPANESLFREGLFRLFHIVKFETVSEQKLPLLHPCHRTIFLMEQLKHHVRQGILTQGCMQNWAGPVLKSRGILDFFEPHACLDFHDVGYETKKLSTRPIEMAINALGAKPEQTVFIEDSVYNLKKAKEYDPRILTVLISPKKPEKGFEPYIDIHVDKLVTFLEYARTVYCAPKLGMGLRHDQ